MTTKTALFALLAMWGVGTTTVVPAFAEDAPPATENDADIVAAPDGFADRVWVQQDTDLPDSLQVFLSDGTLVTDSCWETHRLSAWKMADATHLSWDEDGMPIHAEIVSLTADELVLNVADQEHHYKPATVPYVCPDMPK
ncbi:MAG TPA: hypothetical protein VGM83_04360 [Devosiaceae bacterium]|jgi:hypothetical protein